MTSVKKNGHRRISSITERRRKQLIQLDDTRVRTNPNWDWVNYKGAWTTNIVIICAMRILFGVVPIITPELAWTLTNVCHNIVRELHSPPFYLFIFISFLMKNETNGEKVK
ncbi:hypothetical protein HMI55_000432 [Coelomomyces lativittatus]|nr:hypothetical protein HMI55_000432 [Coelomomyces lativittatus]